jgi:peptidoglycan/LPS O-acetylase OafA/YrhL
METPRPGSGTPIFPPPVRLTPLASGYLDAIRGLAALAVMLGHCRGLFFVDYGHVAAHNINRLVKAIYTMTGFGHQSVMVFFVLSGFFISSSVFRSLGKETWSWMDYVIDRGSRLYVVLIPGLLLGLTWDLAGIAFSNRSGIYSTPLVPFGATPVIQKLAPTDFLGNLFFLQSRFAPPLGSNGPLWSLFNEFWYYVLFPALIVVILSIRRRTPGTALKGLVLAAAAVWILGSQMEGFVVWMAGCAVGLTARHMRFPESNRWAVALYTLCTGAVFAGCLYASRAETGWMGSDLAVGLSFAILTHGILQLHIPMGAAGLAMAKTFAGFSYSLYVLHFPLLLFIRAKWLPVYRWQPDLPHLAGGLGIAGIALLYAYGIARLTEWKTPAVRGWVRNLFGQKPSRATMPAPDRSSTAHAPAD